MGMTQGERIAVLETEVQNQAETMAKMEASMTSMAAVQQQILTELTRYRTIWGVVTMIGSALFAVVAFAKDWIVDQFR